MYKYEIGEDNHEYKIYHKSQFTREEFLNICKEAFNKLDGKIKKEIINSCGTWGACFIVGILTKEYEFSFQKDSIVNIHLCELYEYEY